MWKYKKNGSVPQERMRRMNGRVRVTIEKRGGVWKAVARVISQSVQGMPNAFPWAWLPWSEWGMA